MMSFLKSLMLLVCINQSINPVISTEYWISASTGNDGNNGKSITAPYRSINRIYSERLMSGDIVHLCRGDKWSYTMISHTVSGVIWDSYSCRAAYTKKPVVSPAIDLDFAKWRTSTSNPQVLIYDITGDNTALNTGLRALWVGGVRYSLARWPNLVNPDVTYGQVGEFAQMQSIQGRTLRSTDITQPAGYFTGTRVHWRQANWLYFDTYITGSAPGQMTLDKDWGTQPNFWYFAEANMNGKFPNHLQLLDQGGEYVFDVASKSIYLIPLNEQHRAQILSGETTVSTIYGNIGTAASLVQPGSLIGIEFTMSSGGIWSTAANVNILNCTISHTLGQGFAAQGWKNNIKVMYNEILDIEGSCVEFSSVNGEVSYNKINGCGMYGRNAATWNGITIGGGLVSNNEISNCGYACVHPHYAAAVDRNVINNAMMTLNDGGAIYTFGTTDNGAVITNNVVNYVYGNYASYFPTRIATCMYMDEGSYGSRMQNNSCSGSVQQCVFLHRCFSHSVLMNNCQSPGMYLVEGSGHQIAGNLVRTAGTDGQLQNPLFRMMTRLQPNYINMFTAWDQLYCSSAPAGDYIYQRQTVNGTWRYNKFDDWVADERLVNPDFEASSKMFRNCDGFKPVDINSVDRWGFLKSSSSSSSSTGVSSSSSIISSSSSSSPVVSSSSSSQRPIPSYPLGGCMFRGPYNLVAASVNFTATMRDVDINVGARFLQEVAAWGETRGFDNLYLPSANPMSGLYCTPIMENTFGDEPTYTWIVWLINDRRAVDFAVQFNQMIKTTGFFGQSSGVNALVSPGSVAIQQCPKGVTVRIPASCPGASSSSTGSAVPDNSSKGSEAGITSAGGVAAIIIACVFVSAVLIGGVVYHRYRKTRSGSNGNGGGSSGLFPWSNSSPSFSPQYSPSGSPLAEFSTMDGCAPPSPGLEIGVPMHTFSLDQTSQVEEKKGNSLALPSNQPVTVSPSMSSAPFLGIPISPLGSSSQTYSPSQSCAMYQAMPNSPGSPMVNQQPKAVVDYDRQLAAPLKLPQRFKGRFNPFKAAEKPHKIEVTEPSPSQQPEDM